MRTQEQWTALAHKILRGEVDFAVLNRHEEEIVRLKQVCRNVYEVWAGSEGIPVPETCSEDYLLKLVEQMRDEAKAGL